MKDRGCKQVCWGALPVCEGGGDPGPRGWWRGGPLSSSHPPVPGSAVQTAPPAPWPTPAELLRSHTAPYTLHGPKGKDGGRYTHPYSLDHTTAQGEGVLQKHRHTSPYKVQQDPEDAGFFRLIVSGKGYSTLSDVSADRFGLVTKSWDAFLESYRHHCKDKFQVETKTWKPPITTTDNDYSFESQSWRNDSFIQVFPPAQIL